MNKLIISTLTIFSVSIHSNSLMPIEKWLAQHANDNPNYIASYMSKRCSATFLVVAKIMGEGDSERKRVFDNMVEYASNLQSAAALIESQDNNTTALESVEIVQKDVKRIFDILWEDAEDSYARTGVYLSPIQNDLGYCRLFVEDKN